jgi:hypothetical protein
MKQKFTAFITVCIIASLPLANTASAEDTKLFYRGDYDDQITEAPKSTKRTTNLSAKAVLPSLKFTR